MSDPQSDQAPEAAEQSAKTPELEDGPPSAPKPPVPPKPEGPLDIGTAQRLCAEEIHAVCRKYGFRIFTRVNVRQVEGGSALIDSTWGLMPH